MEIVMSQQRTQKIRVQSFLLTSVISFLLSLVPVQETSLLFVLPFFYVCFMTGYLSLMSYFIGIGIGVIVFHTSIDVIYISLVSLSILGVGQFFRSMKVSYIPFFLTLIAGLYFAYIQIDLMMTLLLTLLTYMNMIIFTYLPPLFIHNQSYLLTHERMKALSVVIFVCMMSLLPYSSISMMIMVRIFILIMVVHQCLEDVIPGLLYMSMLILLMDIGYKDDVLSLFIPLFFFLMIPTRSKWKLTCLYLVSHVMLPFFVDFTYMHHGIIILLSAFLFLLLPTKKQFVLSSSFKEVSMKQQITKQVDSFCHLFEQMTSLFNTSTPYNHSLEYIGYIYDGVCQDCSSCETCFNHQYGPNRLVKLMNKGLKENYNREDIQFIENYCLKPKQYQKIIKDYQKDYVHIHRIQQEYKRMKKDLYHQFSLLNDVFSKFSEQLEIGHIEDKHIYEHLLGYHFHVAHLKKYYESQSVYYLEIGLYETTKDEVEKELVPILETYLNETLDIETLQTPMHHLGYTYVVLKHQTRFYIQYGVAQCSKEEACGDSYTLFTMNENQYFALSDGMGQGQKAMDDSHLTLDVIRQLIMNGISLKDTIHSVNALLRIKNCNDMFTTLDMIQINLVLGEATLLKYGACPTYILRNHEVIELASSSLPMGIVSPLEVSSDHYKLREGDLLMMLSDGFPQEFYDFLVENEYMIGDEHPKDIAQILMRLASDQEINDDMTLLILKLCKQ